MPCPVEATPAGWTVWRGPVPAQLVQLAVDARDHINKYAYGQFVSQMVYNGQTVGIFKSHHTWTNRGGQLVSGICIPGISLLIPAGSPAGMPGVAGLPIGMGDATGAASTDPLQTPDPSAALFGADDLETTDWRLVIETAAVIAFSAGAFWLALKHAGRAASR